MQTQMHNSTVARYYMYLVLMPLYYLPTVVGSVPINVPPPRTLRRVTTITMHTVVVSTRKKTAGGTSLNKNCACVCRELEIAS
jgi:hypothetical protein